jgi:hypothetical protein
MLAIEITSEGKKILLSLLINKLYGKLQLNEHLLERNLVSIHFWSACQSIFSICKPLNLIK